MMSLAESLIRDGTCRYFRWLRGADVTRTPKVPTTVVTGTPQMSTDVPPAEIDLIQRCLQCGCRVSHSTLCHYPNVKIGGLRFSAGEQLKRGSRCGSVVVTKRGGISVYGLVKRFYRVLCLCGHMIDLASVTWLPYPDYPDDDPLTVRIKLHGVDVNKIPELDVLSLNDIQPSRIIVEIDTIHNCLYVTY